jgi:hypothetical protein
MPGTGTFTTYRETPDAKKRWEANKSKFSVFAACRDCNSGWMNDLDHAAELLIEPFTLGIPGVLRPIADQKTVASWLTMIAILGDAHAARRRLLSDTDSRWFFERGQEPFEDSTIWLAATKSSRMEVTSWAAQFPQAETGVIPHTFLLTLRIGDFLAKVFKSLGPVPTDFDVSGPPKHPRDRFFFRKLWPSSLMPVTWPPTSFILEGQLHEFAKRA